MTHTLSQSQIQRAQASHRGKNFFRKIFPEEKSQEAVRPGHF